jgi:excisionase family DNA binding protein
MSEKCQPNPIDDAALERIIQGVVDGLRPMVDRPPKRFLTVNDAADRSGLSAESVRRLLSTGKLTALRPVRGRVLIDVNEFDSLILTSDSRPRNGRGIR